MLLKGGISLGVRNKGSILRIQIFLTRPILIISGAPVIVNSQSLHCRELWPGYLVGELTKIPQA